MRWLVLLATCALGCVANYEDVVVVQVQPGPSNESRALADVERGLSQYGVWSEDDTYGTIWTPNDESFVPYATDGRFADIGGDLVWVSDLPWGTTMHHGHWVRCKHLWSWVPDVVYAGAWVAMHREGDRTTWAPAPPTRIWRKGIAVPIVAPEQPAVGSRSDDELALVPPDPPPQRLDDQKSALEEKREREYHDLARRTAALGEEASEAFDDFGAFDDSFGGGRGGSFGGAGGGARHGASSSVHTVSVGGGRIGGHSSGGGARSVRR